MAGRTLAEVFVSVRPDTSRTGPELQRDLARIDTTKAGERAGDGYAGGFGKGIKRLAAVAAGAFATLQVGKQVKESIAAASDLNETVSKSRNIFGSNAAAIDKWSRTAAKSFGISRAEALGATAQFGDMFQQLGFTEKASAKASTSLVKTAADLGSFHNVEPTDVLQRIQAAFRGEYDSLQALIPNINAARVETVALGATGKKAAKDLTAQEKAQAVLAIVQKDGANAANDFAETSAGLANQQRIAAAQTKDLQAKIGKFLLPTAVSAARAFNTKLIPALSALADKYGPKLQTQLPLIGASLANAFSILFRGDYKGSVFGQLEDSRAVDVLFRIREAVQKAAAAVGPFFASLRQGDTSQLSASFASVVDSGKKLLPVIRQFITDMPAFSDVVSVGARALAFLAEHTETLRKYMPLLIGAVIAYKAAQAAANVAQLLAVPLKVAEVVVNRQLVKSNRELVGSRAAATVATITQTAAETAGTTAKTAGTVATVRQRAATIAATVAAKAARAATIAWTGVQWLLNAAMTANPIGLVIALVAGLVAGIVIAYKKSETFRHIIDLLWKGLRIGALGAISFVLTMIDRWLGGLQTALSFMGKLPGPFGAPFRAMAGGVEAARKKVQELKAGVDKLKPKTVPVTVNIRGRDVTFASQGGNSGSGGNRIRLARGGPIPGYSPSDRSDNINFKGTAGEWVIQKPTVRKLEAQRPGIMAAINAGQVDVGGDPGVMRLSIGRPIRGQKPRGYASGGLIREAQRFASAQVGEPYVWGGTGPVGWDCSGYAGGAYGVLTKRSPYQRYFTTATIGAGQGFRRGLGTFTVGVTPGRGHMAFNLGGMGFEATPPRLRSGRAAAPVTSFARQFYLPSAGGVFGQMPELTRTQISRSVQLVRPGIIKEIFRELGVRQYDSGGWLNPGQLGINLSNRPERVRSGRQEDALLAELRAVRTAIETMPAARIDDRYIRRQVAYGNTRSPGNGW